MPRTLHIRLLGDFRVVADDKLVTSLNTPRLQAFLAYLLLHRDAPQPRHRIAFLFWPDSSENQAQSNLRNLLLALRRSLADVDCYVAIERQSLQWRDDSTFDLDIDQFEALSGDTGRTQDASAGTSPFHADPAHALQQAAELYRGDLLPSCYDEWILPRREQLREVFLDVLLRLVGILEDQHDLTRAILYSQRLVRHDPLREEHYRRLMRLHFANGDRAAVLNVYKQCARILKRELDTEPDSATREIMRQARAAERNTVSGKGQASARSSESGAPSPPPTNLPAQTTIFFGRERETAALATLLRRPDVRLVTITGTAGTGKTRLSINLAASLVNSYPDGVFFVPLATVTSPDKVASAIASALQASEPADGSLMMSLQQAIGAKQILLVIDNFEHLPTAAPILAELLATCPNFKLLITSRAALNLSGEHEYPLAPLPIPSKDTPPRPDELLGYESVALFMDRALEVSPQFTVTLRNARSIAEICRRLEGLPLALELAAARVKVLSPQAILSRLDRRLHLLVGGRSDLPPRQKALETAIAWSYNLLDEAEQFMFRTLSVFSGGFTIEAVERIAQPGNGNFEPLTIVASLLNKSLLTRSEPAEGEDDDVGRFGMLETLKEYAWERLVESGEAESMTRLHALYFAEFAETFMRESNGTRQPEFLNYTDKEHDNLRTAMRWSIDNGEGEIALRLAGSLGIFWERRGYLTEGRRWLGQALALESVDNLASRATALYSSGILALRQRDHVEADRLLQESRALYQTTGNKEGQSNALSALAVMISDSDYEQAVQLHMESLELRRQIGDKAGIARTSQNLGHVKMQQAKWEEASALTQEAHAIYLEMESPAIAYTSYVLAMIAWGQADTQAALERFEECLEVCRKTHNGWLTAWALHGLSELLYVRQQYDESNRALDEAQGLFTELGDKLGVANALVGRGREAYRVLDFVLANRLYREALELGRQLDNHGIIGSCLAGFAGLAGANGDLRKAALLFGCAEALLLSQSTSLERSTLTLNMVEVKSRLNAEEPGAWDRLWDEGTATEWQRALEIALET